MTNNTPLGAQDELAYMESVQKILGTYMSNPGLFDGIEHKVFEDLFRYSHERECYKAIKQFHQNNVRPDIVLLYNYLKEKGFSNKECAYAAGLSTDFFCESQPEVYIDIIFKKWASIKLFPIIKDAHEKLNWDSANVFDVMNMLKEAVNQIDLIINNAQTDRSVQDVFEEMLQRIIDLKNGVIENIGYSFGIKSLDEKTGGLVKGITVIGGQPGQGKTSAIINILKANTIENNIPTIFFSIEMPAVEIMTNIVANAMTVNSRALRSGDVEDDQVTEIKKMKALLKDNFLLDDNGGATWQYIEAKIRSFKKKRNVGDKTTLVLIDYLQIMSNSQDESKMTDEQKLSKICKELTRIAKVENCAIVLLSQLNRENNQRANPRPKMSDLKGSGAIEACAILILLLFRPEYHGIYEDEKGNDLRGLCEINPVKGRYIKPEPVYVKFIGKYSRFEDTDDVHKNNPF